MRFDSYAHVLNFKMTGTTFPAIHDDIFTMVCRNMPDDPQEQHEQNVAPKGPHRVILDVGCCYGLLSARMALKMPSARIVGIDCDNRYIKDAIAEKPADGGMGINTIPNVFYQQFKLDGSGMSLDNFRYLLKEKRIEYVVMRRVLPEIWETARQYNAHLPLEQEAEANDYIGVIARMLHELKIGVFLEGRKAVKNPKNRLSDIESEVAAFQEATEGGWRVADHLKECRFLVPVIHS